MWYGNGKRFPTTGAPSVKGQATIFSLHLLSESVSPFSFNPARLERTLRHALPPLLISRQSSIINHNNLRESRKKKHKFILEDKTNKHYSKSPKSSKYLIFNYFFNKISELEIYTAVHNLWNHYEEYLGKSR